VKEVAALASATLRDESLAHQARADRLTIALTRITNIGPLGVDTYPECYRRIQEIADVALSNKARAAPGLATDSDHPDPTPRGVLPNSLGIDWHVEFERLRLKYDAEKSSSRRLELDLREQISALESREVCAAAHENVDTCGYCQRDSIHKSLMRLSMAMGNPCLDWKDDQSIQDALINEAIRRLDVLRLQFELADSQSSGEVK
jgi:hypothetical protein